MASGKVGWGLGFLAIALWMGAFCAVAQQQPKPATHRRHQRSGKRPTNAPGTPQISSSSVSSGGAVANAGKIPQSGTPTLENQRPTGTLDTLPNQTLTPGATTVPSNSGGIAPASNDASSGNFTPAEGYTAPVTPGGNPSETQGVPTFSSAAQPSDANLPRIVSPPSQSSPAATAGAKNGRSQRRKRATKPPAQ